MNKEDKNQELNRALEESLMEQIRMIPPKEQLEKDFVFSKSFEEKMELIIKKRKRKKDFFVMKAAACVVLLLITGYGVHFFQIDNQSKFTKFASEKEDLKTKEKITSEEQSQKTDIASNDKDRDYSSVLEEEKEDEISIKVKDKNQDNDILESNNQNKEDTAQNNPEEAEKDDNKEEIEMEEDNTDISKASVGDGKELLVVSRLVSAIMEEDSIKIVLQIENNADTNIICKSVESLQVMENEVWMEVSILEGDISDEEKEILPQEEYENTILLKGVSMEKGEKYKLVKTINGEKKEFEFNL